MNATNQKAWKIFKLQSTPSFGVTPFRQRGTRQFWVFAFIFLILVFLKKHLEQLNLTVFTLESIINVCFVLTILGLLWSALWVRTRYVQLQVNKIIVFLPLIRIMIPWADIRDIEPMKFSSLYPAEKISLMQRCWLGNMYKQTGLLIRFRAASLGWKRWFAPWPITGNDAQMMFLPVHNWQKLAQTLPEIYNSRVSEQLTPADLAIKSHAPSHSAEGLPPTNIEQIDVLIVTSRSRQIQELIEYLRLRYHLLVVSTAPDAIQAVRTQHPILVIIDTQRIDGLNALDLIKTLQRQQPQFKSCYLGFTQKPLRPEIALEFFDVGSKEILDVTHSLQLVLNRIDFWFDWQKQVKSMTRRNQELYSQNLFQRSELARYGELQHFLPKNVAQEVMAGIYNVDSHRLRRQTVTILFADIVGFTLLSSQLSPELLAELLNEYLQQMTQVVVNHGGIVDKFIGDEVMALFGAPEEQPETIQVQNAFSAALSMVDVVQILQKKWQKRLALDLNIRVGINTGECTAGVFGSDSLRSYTVIGSPVNLAARLISVAPPGGIVCCENSLKWVKTRTRFIAIGEFSLKGIENLVEVYQIHSVLEPDQIQ